MKQMRNNLQMWLILEVYEDDEVNQSTFDMNDRLFVPYPFSTGNKRVFPGCKIAYLT